MKELPAIIKVEKAYRSNAVANIVVHLCPTCLLEKRTENSKYRLGTHLRHRKCVKESKPRTDLQKQTQTGYITCRMCTTTKPLSEYNFVKSRGYYDRRCADCDSKRQRERHLERKYAMTVAEYEARLLNQNGVCAICESRPPHQEGFSLPVGHCHKTGKVRGILCDFCNQGLGKFLDRPDLLRKAAEYLQWQD